MYIYLLDICLHFKLAVYLTIYLFVYLSIRYMSTFQTCCLSNYLFICISIYQICIWPVLLTTLPSWYLKFNWLFSSICNQLIFKNHAKEFVIQRLLQTRVTLWLFKKNLAFWHWLILRTPGGVERCIYPHFKIKGGHYTLFTPPFTNINTPLIHPPKTPKVDSFIYCITSPFTLSSLVSWGW